MITQIEINKFYRICDWFYVEGEDGQKFNGELFKENDIVLVLNIVNDPFGGRNCTVTMYNVTQNKTRVHATSKSVALYFLAEIT